MGIFGVVLEGTVTTTECEIVEVFMLICLQ